MEFKYQQDLSQIADCPPRAAVPCKRDGFRYVFEGTDRRNFLPVCKINPQRHFPGSKKPCIGFALSMYDSLKNAVLAFEKRSATYPNFTKTIGTHIAQVPILEGDAHCTGPATDGHFSVFEASGCDFQSKLKILRPLVDG